MAGFDDYPDDLVGTKHFFEGRILDGLGQVFDLEIINGSFKGKIRQLPGEDDGNDGGHQNDGIRPVQYPFQHLPEGQMHASPFL